MESTARRNNGFFGHPMGLSTLFVTEMWERFSYYGMRAILILFMTTKATQEGLGLDTATAGAVYGLYTASVYLLTLPGGWLADNIFGQRKAIWYGGILIMIGHAILAIPGTPPVFFLGLAFVASGTGLLKPNISTIVGDLYQGDSGARRDAGFSIFYMGINLGSFLGQIIVPLLADYNWHYGFGFAAIGMLCGLIYYRYSAPKHLGDIGSEPKAKQAKEEAIDRSSSHTGSVGLALAAALVVLLGILHFTGVVDLTTATGIANAMKYIIVLITVMYFLWIYFGGGLNADEKKKVIVIFLLFVGAAIFWAGFEQAGSSLNLFARDFTERNIFGWEMPAGVLQSVNPMFIIIFAPIIGALWVRLAAKQMNPRTPIKFAVGLLLMGVGFYVMVFAAKIAAGGAKSSMLFLILTYFFHSIGELTLSPVGLSTTTKLAPKDYVGQMMGIWFVATALGNLIAGTFGGNFDPENVQQMPGLFMSVFYLALGAVIFYIVLNPVMKKWMGDVT